jgi:hypothetical protein
MCSPSAPSQPTSTSQTTIPEYAQPYAERMLGKAEAATNAPYQTYGGQRVAEATPEQQAARQDVAGMTQPGQFQFGTGLAGAGGIGSLAAGQNYFGMATNPNVQGAFMSPYMQGVVDVAKRDAITDAQKAQLTANLGAARQGTYGGARQLLATTEREGNLQDTLAKIQTSGLQNAYDQAMKSMQFGSQLGLQGAGQATQAGATLGQLGTQQQAAGLDLAKAQETFGGLGQAEQQKALDQAYQDFITQQQYPYKQLGFMSDILRGSANLAATGGKTVYEAPPSILSQVGGLGLAGLGAYNLMNQG